MTPACPSRSVVARHFAGRNSLESERTLRVHLESCHDCREAYRRHQLLSALDPAALPRSARLGRPLGFRRPRPAVAWASAGAAASALLAVLLLAPRGELAPATAPGMTPAAPEYAARGLEPRSRVLAYRRDQAGAVSRLSGAMHPADALAFAVENPEGFAYLLVFAVDEQDRVFWYHPAWTDPAAPPKAIAIEAGAHVVELPEAVRHDLQPGTLELHYLFSHQPHSVVDVERVLLPKRQPGPIFPRAREVIQRVRVEGAG